DGLKVSIASCPILRNVVNACQQRRFLDDADLQTQLVEWRTEVNTERPSRATHVIPAVRLEEERLRLRPLKIAPADLALRLPVVVGPTAEKSGCQTDTDPV